MKTVKLKKFRLKNKDKSVEKTLPKVLRKAPNQLRIPITEMTYRDLKKAAVSRGLEFESAVKFDFPALHSWLDKTWNNPIDIDLLDDFDNYIETELLTIGRQDLIHPQLRLGYIGEKSDEEGNIKIKKPKVERVKKPKREKTDTGLFVGTKKALTYQLQKEGVDLATTITKVLEQFSDASEKSIKIWWKKSQKDG